MHAFKPVSLVAFVLHESPGVSQRLDTERIGPAYPNDGLQQRRILWIPPWCRVRGYGRLLHVALHKHRGSTGRDGGAVVQMLQDDGAAVGARVGRNNPRNRFVNQFLQEVRDRAQPLDLDHPQDEGRADGGERVANIRKASLACTALIEVHQC